MLYNNIRAESSAQPVLAGLPEDSMNNSKVLRSVVGVIFSVLSVLSLLGLVLYSANWGVSAVKLVAALFVGSLLVAVVSFNWEDFKTLPRDLHEFFFVEEPEEVVDEQYVDTSDTFVPYQSPWTLSTEDKKLPPAKAKW